MKILPSDPIGGHDNRFCKAIFFFFLVAHRCSIYLYEETIRKPYVYVEEKTSISFETLDGLAFVQSELYKLEKKSN
jgi:hypothetical protein